LEPFQLFPCWSHGALVVVLYETQTNDLGFTDDREDDGLIVAGIVALAREDFANRLKIARFDA
jgi:hypothetical protein